VNKQFTLVGARSFCQAKSRCNFLMSWTCRQGYEGGGMECGTGNDKEEDLGIVRASYCPTTKKMSEAVPGVPVLFLSSVQIR
jgi:hypothetical protein